MENCGENFDVQVTGNSNANRIKHLYDAMFNAVEHKWCISSNLVQLHVEPRICFSQYSKLKTMFSSHFPNEKIHKEMFSIKGIC